MQMTTPFKLGLTALAALALAILVILLVGDDGADRGGTYEYEGGSGRGGDPDSPLTADGLPRPGLNGRAPTLRPGGAGQRGLLPGLRQPSGPDLSDPDVRAGELARLLQSPRVDWQAVARVLALMEEPVPEELRGLLLQELRLGARNQVMFAFAALNDPSFTEDLFDILDDPEAARGARTAALQALWRMPGADVDQVALRLEARLTQDFGKDREVLYAIAARGGTEATRAMVQYLEALKNPSAVPPYILQTLSVHDNPEAADVVTEALKRVRDPGTLGALISLASKEGASAYTQALIDLDRDGMDEGVRTRALAGLGTISDARAVDYLLDKAAQPGVFGEKALQAVSRIRSGDLTVRAKLREALENADKNPRPIHAKESLLLAVGALRDEKSLPVVAKHFSDPSSQVQLASVRAAGRLGKAARSEVDQLIRLYDKGDQRMRLHVAVALGSIGGEAAVEAMDRMLEEEDLSPSVQRTLKMGRRAAKDGLEREQAAAAGQGK